MITQIGQPRGQLMNLSRVDPPAAARYQQEKGSSPARPWISGDRSWINVYK